VTLKDMKAAAKTHLGSELDRLTGETEVVHQALEKLEREEN
jgi:hypothetical protein